MEAYLRERLIGKTISNEAEESYAWVSSDQDRSLVLSGQGSNCKLMTSPLAIKTTDPEHNST